MGFDEQLCSSAGCNETRAHAGQQNSRLAFGQCAQYMLTHIYLGLTVPNASFWYHTIGCLHS